MPSIEKDVSDLLPGVVPAADANTIDTDAAYAAYQDGGASEPAAFATGQFVVLTDGTTKVHYDGTRLGRRRSLIGGGPGPRAQALTRSPI